MKKLLILTGILLIGSFSGFLSAQTIPNPGFETWNTGTYPTPASWDTPNPDLSTVPGVNGNYVVEQVTTDPHSGTNSILLRTRQYTVITNTFNFPGVITLGNFSVNMSTLAPSITGGIPFTARPDILKGYFKYLPTGTDFATIKVFLYNYNTTTQTVTDTIGQGTFIANGTTSSWTEFQANITYASAATPNYMNIVAVSSNPTSPVAGSQLFLDDFLFVTNPTPDLFISEYVEGAGGNNKVIELFNPTSSALTLSQYTVKIASNGGAYNSSVLTLAGTLAPGAVYLIANASSDAAILALADTTHTVTYFNGDDALGLFKNGVLIDVFGVQGVDPGTAWNAAGVTNATVDHTLVRKPNVSHGNTDWASQAGTDATTSEWIVYPANDFTHLGTHQFGNVNLSPTITGVALNPGLVTATDAVILSANLIDPDGSISTATLQWGLTTAYSSTITLAAGTAPSYSNAASPIPAQVLGTVVYFKIEATDNAGAMAEYTGSYTVVAPPPVKTIYEIQYTTLANGSSTLENTVVKTHGIVTGKHASGYFIQSGTGMWKGIYVYDPIHQPAVGDSVAVTGLVSEYYTMTELKDIAIFTILSSGNTLPVPSPITTLEGSTTEGWEGVLARVNMAACTNVNAGNNMWEVNDGTGPFKIHNLLFTGFTPVLNNQYQVTGPMYFTQTLFCLEPRNLGDIVLQTLSSEKNILGFSLPYQVGNSVIDNTTHSVSVTVLFGTALTNLQASLTISPLATVNPTNGSSLDFTNPVVFTVTAQDGSTQAWTVTVSIAAPSAENAILGFTIPGQTGMTQINATTFSITLTVPFGTVVTALVPVITVSPGATINPASGTAQDFTNPVSYTVTAQTGATQIWTVTILIADPVSGGVFFSEYVEGTSNNKAIEIFNGTANTINLSEYRIAIASNGNGWSNYHTFPAGATLASLNVWVIVANQIDTNLFSLSGADEVIAYSTASPVHFNGNDARALQHSTDGGTTWTTLDIFGTPDIDPGTAWPVAGVANATLDHTLVRKPNITQGNTDWAIEAGTSALDAEWIVNAVNDFSNLGSHSTGGNIPPVISNVTLVPALVTPVDTVILAAQISDLDGSVTSATFGWDITPGSYANSLPLLSAIGVYSTYPNAIPAQPLGTTVYYRFIAHDNQGDSTIYSGSYQVQVPPQEVTIYQIQGQAAASPFVNQMVKTMGIVTAAFTGGYFIQDGTGAWNGIYVYDNINLPTIGDKILITALVTEYYELTELKNLASYSLVSSGNALPAPVTLTTQQVNTEDYESVIVKVVNATCINDDYGFGMWQIDDGSGYTLVHNNYIYSFTPDLGTHYNVTGVLNYTFSEFKIEIRMAGDVTEYVSFQNPGMPQTTLWPVPASDQLGIRSAEPISQLRILDASGRVLLVESGSLGSSHSLEVSQLRPGLYILEVVHVDSQKSLHRFVKE